MADDRPELSETAAEWEDNREPTAEEQAEEDVWFAENLDDIRAKVQAAAAPGRPTYPAREVFDDLHAYIDELYAARDAKA